MYENQKKVNAVLLQLAAEYGVKYICSNDVHFIMADDAPAHDRLICLNTGRDLDDPNRMRYTWQEYLKSEEEMAALFPDHPEALATTAEIAGKVEEYSLEHKPLMPNFPIPDDFDVPLDQLKETFRKKIKDEAVLAEIDRCTDSLDEVVGRHPELSDQLIQAVPLSGASDLQEGRETLRHAVGRCPQAYRVRTVDDRVDGLPGVLPDRVGLYSRRPKWASRWGRAGARQPGQSSPTR